MQRNITDTDPCDFQVRLNSYLDSGWQVVAGSLTTSVSTTSNAWESKAQTKHLLSVIIEKYD